MVEKFSCDDLLDAHKKEREYIEKLNGNLNCIRPTINKEEKNIFLKEYYIKNKEKFKEYKNNNIEKINEYQNEYRQNNKEKMKEYLENNKEKIKENRKIKINCDYCKKEMCKDSIYKHLKVCKFKF
jgi:CO dehydrogenase/acetyl-CoA synthase alpha subunit